MKRFHHVVTGLIFFMVSGRFVLLRVRLTTQVPSLPFADQTQSAVGLNIFYPETSTPSAPEGWSCCHERWQRQKQWRRLPVSGVVLQNVWLPVFPALATTLLSLLGKTEINYERMTHVSIMLFFSCDIYGEISEIFHHTSRKTTKSTSKRGKFNNAVLWFLLIRSTVQ